MSRLSITTSYQAICDCGSSYGEPSDNEMETQMFLREFPTCDNCEKESPNA